MEENEKDQKNKENSDGGYAYVSEEKNENDNSENALDEDTEEKDAGNKMEEDLEKYEDPERADFGKSESQSKYDEDYESSESDYKKSEYPLKEELDSANNASGEDDYENGYVKNKNIDEFDNMCYENNEDEKGESKEELKNAVEEDASDYDYGFSIAKDKYYDDENGEKINIPEKSKLDFSDDDVKNEVDKNSEEEDAEAEYDDFLMESDDDETKIEFSLI